MEETTPEDRDVGDFRENVQPLIRREGGVALALHHIDQPVEDEFHHREDGVSSDDPDETRVNEAVGAHQVDPEVRGARLSVREGRRRGIAVFSTRKEIALEREIGEGMADGEGEEKKESGNHSGGSAQGDRQRLKHGTQWVPL